MKALETLHKIIMDDIFDQRQALLALGCLEDIKTELELSKLRVSDREDLLEHTNMELANDHCQAIDLLLDMGKAIEEYDPEHPVIAKYLEWMHR